MSGIIGALFTAKEILKAIKDGGGEPKEVIQQLSKKEKNIDLIMNSGSITKLVSNYIVEPIIYVSNSAKDVEVLDKVLEVNTDIFSSFYIQAFEILKDQFGLDVINTVKVLGTDNSPGIKGAIVNGIRFALEENSPDFCELLISGESLAIEDGVTISSGNPALKDAKEQPTALLYQRNLEIRMSITKDVDGTKYKHDTIIPIVVKAHVVFLSIDNILLSLKPHGQNKGFEYRWTDYKAGLLSLHNLIFCGDLIAEYKKVKMDDKANILGMLDSRSESGFTKALSNGITGAEGNYNLYVLTLQDKLRVDKEIGGNIYDEKYKQELTNIARAMTVTVIDPDYERVIVLTADIRGRSEVSYKTLNKRKDSGVDLTELMKALMVNKPPVF